MHPVYIFSADISIAILETVKPAIMRAAAGYIQRQCPPYRNRIAGNSLNKDRSAA
jgi:hypothetical protein